MLHEDTIELRRYFTPELEVGVFQSASDLPGKLQRYLSNEEARGRILKAGHRRACEAGYTYDTAARAILEFHGQHSADVNRSAQPDARC